MKSKQNKAVLFLKNGINVYTVGLLASVIMILVISPLNANENKGTTGFDFLRVTYSARAAAMADAYTGLSDDANAVFYNPAGLVQMNNRTISSTYINYFEGFHGGSLVFAFPFGEDTYLAFFSQYLGTGNITRTEVDAYGDYLPSAGTFGANSIVFGVSGSRFIHEMLNIGITGKVIREQLDDHSAAAVAADIALLHQTTNDKLIVGAVLRNFGTQLTYHTADKYEENMPTGFSIGFRYFPHEQLTGVLDINKPFDNEFAVNAGVEYSVHPLLDLRVGYKARANDWRAGGDYDFLSGLSLGFGIERNNYNVDYAVSSYGDLGLVNQISLQYSF